METTSFRIWSFVAVPISYEDILYIKSTLLVMNKLSSLLLNLFGSGTIQQ